MTGKLVSPNDMQEAAIKEMLNGKPPVTRKDWAMCANFWAANIATGMESAVLPLMGMILDCPLTKSELLTIAEFQKNEKRQKP